jgi:hypothetical protein
MLDSIEALLDDLGHDGTNVILTLARIWSTLATGRLFSKDAAASWAGDRLPPEGRHSLARAQAIYLYGERDGWTASQHRLRQDADRLVAEIRRAEGEDRHPVPRGVAPAVGPSSLDAPEGTMRKIG